MAGEDIVLQSNLGRPTNNYKASTSMAGVMYLAKITKMHHKSNTADVVIVKNLTKITSSKENEGNLGARITVSTAHYNEETKVSSGVIEPYQEGQLVTLAFLDNHASSAVILGSYHNTIKEENNPLTSKYPLDPDDLDDVREALKYLRVTPSQMYHKIDGIGAIEVSLPSTTFLKIDPDLEDIIEDKHGGYEHADLSEKDPHRYNNTRKGIDEAAQFPVKMLFVHRSSFYDEYTTWTKFFLDKTGLLRISRDNNDEKVTYMEMTEVGEILVRRHLDTPEFHHDTTPEDYVEMKMKEDANLEVIRKTPETSTKSTFRDDGFDIEHKKGPIESKVTLDADKAEMYYKDAKGTMKMNMQNGAITISHYTGSYMVFEPNGEITLKATKINFNEG